MIVYNPEITCPHWAKGASGKLGELLLEIGGGDILELGGGQSSKWLADRCKSLWTVETDPEWCVRIVKMWNGLSRAHLVWSSMGDDYEQAVRDLLPMSDVVIIDGKKRKECLDVVMGQLHPMILVLDDMFDYVPGGKLPYPYAEVWNFDEDHRDKKVIPNIHPKRTAIYKFM